MILLILSVKVTSPSKINLNSSLNVFFEIFNQIQKPFLKYGYNFLIYNSKINKVKLKKIRFQKGPHVHKKSGNTLVLSEHSASLNIVIYSLTDKTSIFLKDRFMIIKTLKYLLRSYINTSLADFKLAYNIKVV